MKRNDKGVTFKNSYIEGGHIKQKHTIKDRWMTSQNDRVLTQDSSYSRNSLLNARKIKTFPETQK